MRNTLCESLPATGAFKLDFPGELFTCLLVKAGTRVFAPSPTFGTFVVSIIRLVLSLLASSSRCLFEITWLTLYLIYRLLSSIASLRFFDCFRHWWPLSFVIVRRAVDSAVVGPVSLIFGRRILTWMNFLNDFEIKYLL